MQPNESANGRNKPVLMLVEDNLADVRLAQEVLRLAAFAHELVIARDGEQVLRMLRRAPGYEATPLPALILLDLNLPRRDGREVLREIKQDPRLRRIPVLVLSTSKSSADVNDCYDAHANAYLTKPVDIAEFAHLAELIRDFWFGMAQLPRPA
ncbi:Response regulator receiver domain-containing protein [Fontimonas thermophila]|uniref:Response regulator receiver domain-containing protein n=1 Tax=Fontimonas thermophila TaxID=1076937 RepID=A0A1I2IXR6_9GAMM|nr:response regulator [Fontimonas thermophila]SFF45281.1 Response regulator receiver domain-containing protein [Fontimonas thermophila]